MNPQFIKTNYHTHTTWCDGKNTAEEMVRAAIEKHVQILGFSSHSMYPFAGDYHITPENHKKYCEEIRALAQKYKDQITIYCGFESDFIPHLSAPCFEQYGDLKPDFLIGSVHYVMNPKGNGYFEADGEPEEQLERINRYFGGNKKLAVQCYFDSEKEMLRHGDFTFLGHCDLIRIRNKQNNLFNENDLWYRKELKSLAAEIKKAGVCAEINTGGVARKRIDSYYPSPYFLELLHDKGIPLTVNTDAHNAEFIDFGLDDGREYAKRAGYTELMLYTNGSLVSQKI